MSDFVSGMIAGSKNNDAHWWLKTVVNFSESTDLRKGDFIMGLNQKDLLLHLLSTYGQLWKQEQLFLC